MYVIKFGDVWFENETGRKAHICGPSEELAIAYDPDTGTLLKRGSRASVEAWRQKSRKKMIDADLGADILDPTLVAFPADQTGCEFLNRVADNSSLIEAMIRRGDLPAALDTASTTIQTAYHIRLAPKPGVPPMIENPAANTTTAPGATKSSRRTGST